MRQHVRKHTKGFHCSHCQKCFSTRLQLHHHTSVHQSHERFDCADCEAFFFLQTSLKLHCQGKHGPGWCGLRFDSPSQRQRYMKNC